jgi:hypothetical protein
MISPARSDAVISCPRCGFALSNDVITGMTPLPCTHCGAEIRVAPFPALFKDLEPGGCGEQLQTDREASCFYHPDKRAVVPCAVCGRFLCSLCDIQLAAQRLCPSCVEQGKNEGRLTQLVTQRTLHDQIALSLAVIPLLFFWITIVTAPTAIYLAIRNWTSPSSLLPRTKVRFIFAIVIGALQVFGWTAFLVHSMI